MLNLYIPILSSALISFLCIALILRLPAKFIALDKPNSRSLHEIPTPRLGGIAILTGIILSLLWLSLNGSISSNYSIVLLSLALVAGISIVDDFYSISFVIRMIVHLLAAFIIVDAGYAVTNINIDLISFTLPTSAAVILSILFIVWMINLYNFMDGVDGIAGGMAVFGFATFALIGFIESQTDFAISSLVISFSALGFLFWNYPSAKIFMGDGGSSSLGLLAAILALYSHSEGFIPIWISVVIFSPFIVDATVTLILRILRRERFWDAHKSHFYQQLAETGISRKKLVNLEYGLILICSIIALITYKASSTVQLLSLLGLATLYFVLMRYIVKKTV